MISITNQTNQSQANQPNNTPQPLECVLSSRSWLRKLMHETLAAEGNNRGVVRRGSR